MSAMVYSDYQKDRIGRFFGLTGWQLGLIAATLIPVVWALSAGAWGNFLLLGVLWIIAVLLIVVPIHGRSAIGWLVATASYTVGSLRGWTTFRSRAASGNLEDLTTPDLPGILHGVRVLDGTPTGPDQSRIALIQHLTTHTWALTASVQHPGIGLADATQRWRAGEALTELLDLCARTELVDEITFMVRTTPDDGAEREHWMASHHRPGALALSDRVNADLAQALTQRGVRTESFVTIVIPEARLARPAKESGGGLEGRARVLQAAAAEVSGHLSGAMGMANVSWLTSPELAAACRTGFAPTDRASIIDAVAASRTDETVNADVAWAMAGPSGADPVIRHYSHDAWNSISSTIKLPPKGAVMGALAPILTPAELGERRSFVAVFPIVPAARANRHAESAESAADAASGLRERIGRRANATERKEAQKTRELGEKLARGNSLTRAYAVCTTTVPKTVSVADYGRRLDASIRQAGFSPQRLDVAQDTAFAASAVPMGASLTRRGES